MSDKPDESQKTEEATPRKLEEARKKGDVPMSKDVSSLMQMIAAIIICVGLGPLAAVYLVGAMRPMIDLSNEIPIGAAHNDSLYAVGWLLLKVAIAILPVLLLLAAAGVGAGMLQTGLVFAKDRINPKLDRLDPVAGAKRLFGGKALFEFGKGSVKLLVIAFAVTLVVFGQLERLRDMAALDVGALPDLLREATLQVLIAVTVAVAGIAAVDLIWQRWSWKKQNRMTKQEVKDEIKQSEGDPEVKAALKSLRKERARRRMAADVPKATVVVTNPTHYAVALKYDPASQGAPICVGKGMNHQAKKIREIAADNEVPLVENPPLARALHASVELDQEIPPAHYKAVAEVINYVFSLKRPNVSV